MKSSYPCFFKPYKNVPYQCNDRQKINRTEGDTSQMLVQSTCEGRKRLVNLIKATNESKVAQTPSEQTELELQNDIPHWTS